METSLDFDALKTAWAQSPSAGADDLILQLEQTGDYAALFYAILLKKRLELGISPFPAGPASDVPPHAGEAYEEAIRLAARKVGQLFLERKQYGEAWQYFSLIHEQKTVQEALQAYQPQPEEDLQDLIHLCLYQGVDILRGFTWVVERFGICNAITTYSGFDFSKHPEEKQTCIQLLIRNLHEQLTERLKNDLMERQLPFAETESLTDWLKDRPQLFEERAYHVDTSHLSSILQFALELKPGLPELKLARELAHYGKHLDAMFLPDADAPFDAGYADYERFLEILDNIRQEENLAYFLAKVKPAAEDGHLLPAEILVHLLLRLGRKGEARQLAFEYLAGVTGRTLICPGIYELCLEAKDYGMLAEAAKLRGDAVSYLAALQAAK